MASSASDHRQQQHVAGATPGPPPPTPSNHALAAALPSDGDADADADADAGLSRLLSRLLSPPTLSSPPPRFRAAPTPRPPPLISLPDDPAARLLLSAASDFGFFHVADRRDAPSHLAGAALLEAQSLLRSDHPSRAALGFSHDEGDDDGEEEKDTLLVLDASSSWPDAAPALREHAERLERVGIEVVERLFSGGGFTSWTPTRCLLWVSSSSGAGIKEEEEEGIGWRRSRSYPYVVCVRSEKKPCWVVGDSGDWVAVAPPRADSFLVTLGDIAQVWSNGRFKKVRGIPESSHKDSCNSADSVSISLLVTLPMDSVIFPLLEPAPKDCNGSTTSDVEGDGDTKRKFCTFPFEEYAWRSYHERFSLKDPLLRYRI